jgi:hypothetical protein
MYGLVWCCMYWTGGIVGSLEWRCTYLGDIVVVALCVLEAEFLRGSDIPVCWLVGLRVDNRVTVVLVLGLERHIDTMIDNSEPRIRIETK